MGIGNRNGHCRDCRDRIFAFLGIGPWFIMEESFSLDADPGWGPNRVGRRFAAIGLPTLKLLVKEGMTPDGADKMLFNVAPIMAMVVPCC